MRRLGMPRSGTSLVHQIISNHHKVHGAGELTKLNKFVTPFLKDYKNNNSPISKNDLIFLPYMNYGGTISPYFNLNTKAEIFGLLPHHQRDDILLAAYQGLGFSIRDCYDSLNIKMPLWFAPKEFSPMHQLLYLRPLLGGA